MKITPKRLWIGIAGFVVAGAGVALATGDIWGDHFDPTVPKSFSVELRNTADNSHDQKIDVTRGPVDPVTNTALVSVTLTLQQSGVTLNSMSLKVGNDTNHDGTIQPSELSTVATANITSSGGVTTATITNAVMPTNKDCYRVCYNRSDYGDHYDEIFSNAVSPFTNQ
jgi:hypothetical protein